MLFILNWRLGVSVADWALSASHGHSPTGMTSWLSVMRVQTCPQRNIDWGANLVCHRRIEALMQRSVCRLAKTNRTTQLPVTHWLIVDCCMWTNGRMLWATKVALLLHPSIPTITIHSWLRPLAALSSIWMFDRARERELLIIYLLCNNHPELLVITGPRDTG